MDIKILMILLTLNLGSMILLQAEHHRIDLNFLKILARKKVPIVHILTKSLIYLGIQHFTLYVFYINVANKYIKRNKHHQ